MEPNQNQNLQHKPNVILDKFWSMVHVLMSVTNVTPGVTPLLSVPHVIQDGPSEKEPVSLEEEMEEKNLPMVVVMEHNQKHNLLNAITDKCWSMELVWMWVISVVNGVIPPPYAHHVTLVTPWEMEPVQSQEEIMVVNSQQNHKLNATTDKFSLMANVWL